MQHTIGGKADNGAPWHSSWRFVVICLTNLVLVLANAAINVDVGVRSRKKFKRIVDMI